MAIFGSKKSWQGQEATGHNKRITRQVEITLGSCQADVAMEIRVLLSPNGAPPAGGGGRPVAS